MKNTVVKKVFECRECGGGSCVYEGYIWCTMELCYDDQGNSYFKIIDYESSECSGTPEYECGSCDTPPCIDDDPVEDENELDEYIELYGVEQKFEVEVPEDTKA